MKKNNRLIYLLIILLTIWCVVLSTIIVKNKDEQALSNINEIQVTGISTDFTEIVDDKSDSIVTISSSGTISSGFIYSQDGDDVYIVTSYHGIADGINNTVYFESGYSINAEVVGTNEYADLAVLKVNIPYSTDALTLGDSSLCKAGELVIAIGTPVSLEYSHSTEMGMISNNIKTIENSITVGDNNIIYYLDVLQLSSNLKPGYSGSPIINMNGEVVGMVTMSLDERFNFAITANEIKIIANKLIKGDTVKKYQLGVKGSYVSEMPLFVRSNLNLSVDTVYGLYVEKLLDTSICNVAGIQKGDIILSINGVDINNINDYLGIVYSENDAFEFETLRDGEIFKYKVTIDD